MQQNSFAFKAFLIILLVVFIIYMMKALSYRIYCDKNKFKFKDSFGTRLGILAIVSVILAILALVATGIMTFGSWLMDAGYNSNIPGSGFEVFAYFVLHIFMMGIGAILVLLAALMAIIYILIELYTIWVCFVKPAIATDKDNDIREVESDGETWKEV